MLLEDDLVCFDLGAKAGAGSPDDEYSISRNQLLTLGRLHINSRVSILNKQVYVPRYVIGDYGRKRDGKNVACLIVCESVDLVQRRERNSFRPGRQSCDKQRREESRAEGAKELLHRSRYTLDHRVQRFEENPRPGSEQPAIDPAKSKGLKTSGYSNKCIAQLDRARSPKGGTK